MPVYINLVDVRGGGKELTLYFSHMTVKIVGKGLEELADGIRRQVIPYIQEQHVSEFEAKQEVHYVESLRISAAAEPEELGSWAG
jgi:predicted subunit of tRNA(5-methylaminomethyl-2-thiouridylate) methyltransferase